MNKKIKQWIYLSSDKTVTDDMIIQSLLSVVIFVSTGLIQ